MATSLLENDGKHLSRILQITTCRKHKAQEGDPCFVIDPGTSPHKDSLFAACGARVKRAGYNGKISATSFQVKRSNNSSEGRKPFHKKR